jgi:site-specific DNA recombinase
MFQWVRKNALRQKIEAVLNHKLDRICRNMRDAVRMQELEDERGVKLSFVENQFGPGAAGALSFNVLVIGSNNSAELKVPHFTRFSAR